jgi:hypothetical protein
MSLNSVNKKKIGTIDIALFHFPQTWSFCPSDKKNTETKMSREQWWNGAEGGK